MKHALILIGVIGWFLLWFYATTFVTAYFNWPCGGCEEYTE